MLATLALGTGRDVTCANDATHDTALLSTTINASAAGDVVRIHGSCVVRETANNKVHAFRPDLNATSAFVFVGVSGVAAGSAPGVVGVHGNIVRGAGRAGEVGLRYEAGGGNLEVSSTANHVHGVGGTVREMGARVTLANTY